MNALDVMQDRNLCGRSFEGLSWEPWRAFVASLFALPMTEAMLCTFRTCTGRENPPTEPVREGWVIAGRRSGKSRVAALLAVFLACFKDHGGSLAPGERGTVMVLAADRAQARVVFRYISGLINGSPMLSQLVEARTAEAIHLRTGITLEIHAASFRSVRGYTIVGAVLDEIAFWRSDDSANPDAEIVKAIAPGMATVDGSLLLAIGSPYARRGVLWGAYRDFYSKDDPRVIVWRAPTRVMNATVPQDVIDAAYARDPASAAAEWGAEFRTDVETFVSREIIDACTIEGRHELPPCEAFAGTYEGFVDPSGGVSDSMTLAIGHREDDRVVVDLIREAKAPFSPADVVSEFADTLNVYGLASVSGDQYGAAWVSEAFRKQGITYTPAEKPKSALYVELLPALNSGQVELLDHRKLAAQLTSLERRTARGGRDSIDHPPGGHDDVANCVAGVCQRLATRRKPSVTRLDLGSHEDHASPWALDGPCLSRWPRETL